MGGGNLDDGDEVAHEPQSLKKEGRERKNRNQISKEKSYTSTEV